MRRTCCFDPDGTDRISSGEERRCSVCDVCRMQASSGMHERRATVLKYLRDAEAGTHERASAKAEGETVIILVDFENTHASGLEGYTYLNESDTLVMYYSDENSAVTKGVVEDLRKNGVHVRLVKLLKQHSNALDMYIASTTGMFLDSGEKICIVSKDHGYAAVRDFWHSLRGAEILLGETIKQCLLSSELNDEARIRLCKEREQKAMLVDAFTTMNTIPTRPTLSRSNQRRRRNDTRNFMEVSEPVAILPNPLMTETPADQLAKELSSAVAKSENAAREAQPETAPQPDTAMTASVSSDNASDVAAVTEAEASTTTGRGERGGRGRNGRNRRNDQNHRNDRNDRSERDDRNAQNRSDATAAEKIDSEQRTGRETDARTQNARSTREQDGTAEQNTTSEPVQERFGGYDGIMKMNEASRIALDKRQERDERKDEHDEPFAARNRNHPKQNAQPAEKNRRDARSVNDEKQRTSENRKQEEKSASEDTKKDIANAATRTQVTQETTALVKAEKKTTAVAKVDPNRVQFVWDPVTRSMKRVGGPAEESAEKKDDAPKTEATEKNAEFVDEKTADRNSENSAATDVTINADATEKNALPDAEKNQSAVTTKTVDVSDAVAEKGNAAEEKHAVDATVQAREAAADHRADVSYDATTSMEEKTAVDRSKTEDVQQPAAEAASVQLVTAPEKTPETDITGRAVAATEEKTDAEHVQAGQDVATDDTKPDVETKKSGAHRKSKKSASVKKESDASEKPADTKKAATSSKPKAKKKAAVKHEKASEKDAGASVKTSAQDAASASEKPEMKSESTASASKKATKKTDAKKPTDKSAKTDRKMSSAEQKTDTDNNKKSADHTADTDNNKKSVKKESTVNGKSEKSSKKVEEDVTADVTDAQPALQMTEEDIQLTKKKYSEGINTLHTYYVRLMKAFGREQGRAIYESTKKSVQEDIKTRKAQLAAQNAQLTTETENN